jgi:hypothetical protein
MGSGRSRAGAAWGWPIGIGRGASSGRLADVLLQMVSYLALLATSWLFLASPSFAPDTWSYWELSQSIAGGDFYRVATIRQFQFDSAYGVSFPPLYPMLLAVAGWVWDVGIYTGAWVNLSLAMLTLWLMRGLGPLLGLPWWAGQLLFFSLLLNVHYLDEVVGTGSLPLALLCWVAFVRGWLAGWSRHVWGGLALGLAAGGAALTRFDSLPLAAAALFLVVGRAGRGGWPAVVGYLCGLALLLGPWIHYGSTHFGRALVSDNSRTALLAIDSYPLDYFPAAAELPTLLTAPRAWVELVVTRKGPRVLSSMARAIAFESMIPQLVGLTLLWVAARRLRRTLADSEASRRLLRWWLAGTLGWLGLLTLLVQVTSAEPADLWFPVVLAIFSVVLAQPLSAAVVAGAAVSRSPAGGGWWRFWYWSNASWMPLFVLLVSLQIPLLATTGFKDRRYFVVWLLFVSWTWLAWLGRRFELAAMIPGGRWARVSLAAVGLVAVPIGFWLHQPARPGVSALLGAQLAPQFRWADHWRPLVESLHRDTADPRLLVISGIDPFHFGALTGVTTLACPSNLDPVWGEEFLRRWRVTHVIDRDGDFLASLAGVWRETSQPGLVVYLPAAEDSSAGREE